MNEIEAINKSLRAFVCGLFGLLPVIGLIPAIHALRCRYAVRKRFPDGWNPAARYLKWSFVLSLVGLFNSVLAAFVVAIAIIENMCP